MADHSRLGRGLASLMGDVAEESPTAPDQARKPRRAPIESLKANPRNPRKNFTDTELNELAASIKERGVIQPIVVRAIPGERDNFEIIAGERRWRAAQRAGLHEVPIAVVEATDKQSLEFAIIENVQRADLNPIEEATRLRAVDGRSRLLAGRGRADRRQEPAACDEHAAAVEAGAAGAALRALRKIVGRPRAAADRRARCRADRLARDGARFERARARGRDARRPRAPCDRRARARPRRVRKPARTPIRARSRRNYPTRSV